MTKITIPIMGKTIQELFNQMDYVNGKKPDIIEWRADHLAEQPLETILDYGRLLENRTQSDLLVTFRTVHDGGHYAGSRDDYHKLINAFLDQEIGDYLDYEWSMYGEGSQAIFAKAEQKGVRLILSYHNFQETLLEQDIYALMMEMSSTQPNIIKLAFMPKDDLDVLKVMSASYRFKKEMTQPFIMIAMDKLGEMTRTYAPRLGSYMTFAKGVDESAPGQVEADLLRQLWS